MAEIADSLGLVHSSEQVSGLHKSVHAVKQYLLMAWHFSQGEALGKRFLVQLLVNRFERRTPQHEAIAQLPLYPDERTPWDPAVVPDADFQGDMCLALPKLNLQFLTVNDYLMRNFQLFRLEATYEIKEDIQAYHPPQPFLFRCCTPKDIPSAHIAPRCRMRSSAFNHVGN